jgi:arabinogalactan oligomer/maltooligosaccharide transport system permease protein
MLGFIVVLMVPSIATITALFVLLNIVLGPTLRNSIFGVGVAMVATSLPFAIWYMKGFIDTIPRELEEAAYIDGATANQTFFAVMLPLALPGLAVTALLGFMAGWQEFALSWQFISNPKWFTLTMALYGMQGQYAANTPWSQFAAMSILVSIPILIVFFALQKYIIGGLTLGGVKG